MNILTEKGENCSKLIIIYTKMDQVKTSSDWNENDHWSDNLIQKDPSDWDDNRS